jgi:hypothetical protein
VKELPLSSTAAIAPRATASRLAYGALAALLLASIAFAVVTHVTGLWQIVAFGLGPDLALFYGASTKLQKGQLHPRAVPVYNLVHRLWLPGGLIALASFDLVPLAFFVGGLAWCFHISLDRALGYGLRTRDGFQRP